MEQRRVTQLDVARKAGVHRATVSMVFRNHPNIPAETRARIRRIADELGYHPDPMLSALAAYRSRCQPAAFHGTLAWLVNSTDGYDWRTRPHFVDYHAGARARAEQHGYRVELFDLHAPGLTSQRVASILRARNITGILLCPQPHAEMTVDFPWSDFSAVTFGYSLARPQLHTVAATQYRAMLQTVQELHAVGYRRIGLCLDRVHDNRTGHHYLAGYLAGTYLTGQRGAPRVLDADYGAVDAVRRWLARTKPDAVVTGNYQFLRVLQSLGISVPADLGVACPVLPSPDTRLAGVVENSLRIGSVAVDYLVAMMNRGERGIPPSADRVHVEGRWIPGRTLRRRAAV